jgi:SpoVK/Ycf46/Vps4 family AAA+-type ATPase
VPLSPDIDFKELAARMDGLTGADIESLCKKATLSAIVEIQRGARLAPFVVTRGDFLAVLESERSSPKHLNATNEPGSAAGDLCRDVFTSTKY